MHKCLHSNFGLGSAQLVWVVLSKSTTPAAGDFEVMEMQINVQLHIMIQIFRLN